MKAPLFLLVALVAGCDAWAGKVGSLGSEAHIECWSGDTIIYSGRSTGKVMNSESSDGYYFLDAKTRVLTEVSGNCIVTYGKEGG